MANFYRFLKDTYFGLDAYAISGGLTSTMSIAEGDMMQWDYTSKYSTNALLCSGSIFLGVTYDCNPMASLGTSTAPLTGGVVRIGSQGIFQMKTTSSEVYKHLDPVYQGADAQTVSLTGSTRIVGRVHLPGGSTVTGATGTFVPVRILGSMTNNSTVPSSAAAAQ